MMASYLSSNYFWHENYNCFESEDIFIRARSIMFALWQQFRVQKCQRLWRAFLNSILLIQPVKDFK